MFDFLFTGGELVHAAAVDDVDIFSTQALCGTGRIHRDVAAADDCNILCVLNRRGRIIFIRLHQVASGEEFICRVNTLEVFTGDIHEAGKTGTGTNEDGFIAIFFFQLLNRQDTSDDHIGLNLDAECLEVVDFLLDDRLGQTEFRDTIDQNTAGEMQCLINRDVIAHLGQIACAGQASRAGTDNRNLMAIRLRTGDSTLSMGVVIVGDKPFQTADGDRLALDAADAFPFALGLLRADTSADSRQGRGLADDLVCTLKVTCRNLGNKFRDMDIDRAAGDTGFILTVEASLRFVQRHLFGIAEGYLLEVFVADIWVLRRHRILGCSHIRHDYWTSLANRLQVSS